MIEFWLYLLIFPVMGFFFWIHDLMEEHLRKVRLDNDKKEQQLREEKKNAI